MKFKEYVENLNKLIKDIPEVAEMQVVTSKDDEGDGYNLVHYSPTVGNYDGDGEFDEELEPNAVCVN